MTIELQDITKTFVERSWRTLLLRRKPKRVQALNGVSLKIGAGEICGILGPNGAGKTTLIKILATLILSDSGDAAICGYDLGDQPQYVRRLIGLVNTSERSFYWRLTGRQNLNFFAALYNLPDSDNGRERIENLLDLVDLIDKADTPFMKYSTGQKQRLALARALLPSPQVLLMDEPTNSLDPLAASEFRKFTRKELKEKQGKTILWCTHNLKEAQEVCDQMAIIHRGKVIASGSLEHMKTLMGDDGLYHITVDHWPEGSSERLGFPPMRAVRNNGFVELELREKQENMPCLLKGLLDNGINVYSCTHKEIELENIFERVIGHG